MGIHSGPVHHVAEDLEHYNHWQPHLHDLGECEVKHGVRLSLVNLYTDQLGNALPAKFKLASAAAAASGAKYQRDGEDIS